MKIAFVVHDYHRSGGHSRYVAELASRFSKDHEVHVFANQIARDDDRIHYHIVPAWRANVLTTLLSFALPVTFQVGRDFDVVHSQGFCGFLGNVFTVHMCNRAWDLALRKLEGGTTLREAVFNRVASVLEHVIYRFTPKCEVIAISDRSARDIVNYYHCTAPMHVIYHGVDSVKFSPATRDRWRAESRQAFGFNDEEFVFLYVGNLRKGAKRCMEALTKVPHGRLLCVAATEPSLYKRFAAECGIADRVVFSGHTSQVEKIYAAADAMLLPTPYDPFALVVTEAMACGLPVVVSREAGAAELIKHGTNGLLLEDVTSHEELAGHMRFLENDRNAVAAIGRNARALAEKLTWDSVADQTMSVYERVSQAALKV